MSELVVEVVGPDDLEAIEVAAGLITKFHRETVPEDVAYPGAELAGRLRHPMNQRRGRATIARDGAEVVGFSLSEIDHSGNDAEVLWVWHLVVASGHRRRGIGTALLADLADHARTHGRRTLIGAAALGDPAADGFAGTVGATRDLVEEDNRLLVADLDPSLLGRWIAAAPSGYSLVTWEGRAPDDLVEPMCEVLDAMNDAPMHAGLEPMRFTPERYDANQEAMEARGALGWQAAIRYDATGRLAAYTELGRGPHRPAVADQGLTCVHPAHRGQGLGKWVKAANLIVTLDRHPEVGVIVTDNAGANAPMLAINRALGYRTVRTMQSWLLQLADP